MKLDTYCEKNRRSFSTVGELCKILNQFEEDTPIFICGSAKSWLHAPSDMTFICLDCDELAEEYLD